jgi:hypothetical protein
VKKEGWPEFPFYWIEKPDMSSLQIIAFRLKEKVESSMRAGFIGETTPIEKQIIEHISGLHQQVAELNDALQAALQIIDDRRFSVRTRKALGWLLVRVARFVQIIRDNTFLTILGAVSTLAFVITVLIYLIHFLRK